MEEENKITPEEAFFKTKSELEQKLVAQLKEFAGMFSTSVVFKCNVEMSIYFHQYRAACRNPHFRVEVETKIGAIMDNVTEALRKGNRAYNSAYTLAARLALKEAVKDMFAKPSPVEIIGILLSRAERSKGKKRREALAMLDKYVTDTYPPVKGAPLPSAELERENNYSNVRYTKGRNYEL